MLELAGVILDELEKLTNDPVSDAEIARAKAQLKSGLLMSLESSGSRAEQVARQTLAFGAPRDIDELVEKVEAVSKEAVRVLAGEIILCANPSVSAVGPLQDEGALEALIHSRYSRSVRAAE